MHIWEIDPGKQSVYRNAFSQSLPRPIILWRFPVLGSSGILPDLSEVAVPLSR
jgi:hypothetical protein